MFCPLFQLAFETIMSGGAFLSISISSFSIFETLHYRVIANGKSKNRDFHSDCFVLLLFLVFVVHFTVLLQMSFLEFLQWRFFTVFLYGLRFPESDRLGFCTR
jgi:hypothetical protein